MPFFELLQSTDILITVSPVANDLSGCLPMSGIPYELSLGNRPLLWHCLAPLVDAGGHNFFIAVLPEWQVAVRAALKNFADHYHLRTNITLPTTTATTAASNKNEEESSPDNTPQKKRNGNDDDEDNNNNAAVTASTQKKVSVIAAGPSSSSSALAASSAAPTPYTQQQQQPYYNGEVNFTLVLIDETAFHESQDVAQVVQYARYHRSSDSVKDFLVVNYDTLLSPEVITTFLQGFHINFASSSVLYLERDAATEKDSDYLCLDDPIEHTPVAFPGTMFADHRRVHLSEPLPCDTEHSLRSSMLMRRPQLIFTKRFRQLPVFIFKPWVAQALVLHFDAVVAQQQRRKEAAQQENQQNNNSTSNKKNKKQSNHTHHHNNEEEETIIQMFKLREELVPALTMWQFSSLVALPQEFQSSSRKLRFRNITSTERLSEDLGLPSSFKIKPHWCLSTAVSSVYATTLPQQLQQQQLLQQAQQRQQQQQQQNSENLQQENDGEDDDDEDDEKTNSGGINNNTNNTEHHQQLVSSSFGSVLLPTPTIDVLNAAGPNLASSTDEIRIFCTLVRRSDYTCSSSSTTAPTETCQNVFPIVKRVDSADSYYAISTMLRAGLETNPAPVVVNSIQKYSIPDMHKATLDLLVEDYLALQEYNNSNDNSDTSSVASSKNKNNNTSNNLDGASAQMICVPKNLQRCGLMTVPPCPGTFSSSPAASNFICRVERSIIGRSVKFAEAAGVFDSVVMDDVELGKGCVLRSCVVGPKTIVKPDSKYENAILCGNRVEYFQTAPTAAGGAKK